MKKKNTRPNYPMVDFSGASDETAKAVCRALAEEEKHSEITDPDTLQLMDELDKPWVDAWKRRKAKTSRTTHV